MQGELENHVCIREPCQGHWLSFCCSVQPSSRNPKHPACCNCSAASKLSCSQLCCMLCPQCGRNHESPSCTHHRAEHSLLGRVAAEGPQHHHIEVHMCHAESSHD